MSDAEDEVVFHFVKKCVDEHGRGGGGSGTANYEALGSRLRSSSTVEAAVVRRVLLALARCAPALVSGVDADGSTDGGTGGGVAGCCAPGHVAGGRHVVAWARHRSLLEAALSFGARAGTAPPAAVRAFGEFLSQVKRVPPRNICERRAVAAPCAVCPRSNLSPLDRTLACCRVSSVRRSSSLRTARCSRCASMRSHKRSSLFRCRSICPSPRRPARRPRRPRRATTRRRRRRRRRRNRRRRSRRRSRRRARRSLKRRSGGRSCSMRCGRSSSSVRSDSRRYLIEYLISSTGNPT